MQTNPVSDPESAGPDAAAEAAAQPSPDLTVDHLMRRWPAAVEVLTARRMACPGCAMAPFMTVGEAARAYGLPADLLLADLRRALALGRGTRHAQ